MIAPFDALLAALLSDLHARIDWRCATELLRCREEAEHARRSLGQSFRWVRTP